MDPHHKSTPQKYGHTSTLTVAIAAATAVITSTQAEDFRVTSAREISAAMRHAQPGDTLSMANGVWMDQVIAFTGSGTKDKPITLRAQTPGAVILNGASRLNISGSWLVVDGLRFEDGALNEDQHVIAFRGSLGDANHSRLTNCAIVSYNPKQIDTRYFWVSIFGHNNRVDHNYFKNHNHSGVTVVAWRKPDVSDHHRIDHNYFVDRPQGNANGWESIRIGTSADSLSDSHSVVEHNLFERVNGELEIISNKSGRNVYRYNTFRSCAGTLTLRYGHHVRVEGNYFFGAKTKHSGGIRVIGQGHTIINNYLAEVDNRAGGAISISAAVPVSDFSTYFPVQDVLIAHNTVVNTLGPLMTFDDGLGRSGRTLLARKVTVANNIFLSNGSTIFEGHEGKDWTWLDNIAFGADLGPKAGAPGITVVNPQLVITHDGLWRPAPNSPALNAATKRIREHVTRDMDGQPRSDARDIGADELSHESIDRKWLTPEDVGPAWLKLPPKTAHSPQQQDSR